VEILKHWLNSSRDYISGVKLYVEFGDNDDFKDLFLSEGYSVFKEQKLHELITELYRGTKSPNSKVKTPVEPDFPPTTSHQRWPAHPIEDPVIDALWRQWRPVYSEMLSLQHRIYEVAIAGNTDQNKHMEAGQMAIRIKDLEDQVQGIYQERDFYVANGILPGKRFKDDDDLVDPLRWAIELKNNERYVRDYRLKISKDPNNKNAVKWAAALKEKEAAVIKLKRLLKID
jgi:hypothetical protein